MSVRLSVRLLFRMEQLGSHWMEFHEIQYLRIFENQLRKCTLHYFTAFIIIVKYNYLKIIINDEII
jgi:hypothetical protein